MGRQDFDTGVGDTPVLRLFRRHCAILAAARVHPSTDDEERDRLFFIEADRIQDAMMAIPSSCAADFAAKAIVATCRGETFGGWEDWPLWAEARALTGEAA